MKRLFGCISAGLTIVAAPASPALAQAADKPEAIVCQLLDNCADQAVDAATGEKPRAVRRGEVRGFSLARPASPAAASAAVPTAAPTRGRVVAVSTPTRAKPAAAAQHGQYDLRVQFMTGSAEVNPISRAQVDAFAVALKDPRLADRRIRIEGHTDSSGNAAKNQDLSQRRAQAIADMLASNGVDTGRLDVKGYGSSQPLPGTAPRNGANRRVVAVLAN